MTVNYYKKNIYGKPMIYLITKENPVLKHPNDGAETILQIINQKTISRPQMALFEQIGVQFVEAFDPTV